MNNFAYDIAIGDLLLISIPVIIVMAIYIRWSLSIGTILYATARMVIQLVLVGYAFIVIFNQSNALISSSVIVMMLLFAGWIALRPIKKLRRELYLRALFALVLGGVPVLAIVIGGVVKLNPWYMPRYLIPLAGMIFANGMNSVSLCAERFYSEMNQGKTYLQARPTAYQTALLPITNSFFAVGLVSIPGMMTGQILAGVSPLLAVRYQIMVMCMIFGTCGISSAIFLYLVRNYTKEKEGKSCSIC